MAKKDAYGTMFPSIVKYMNRYAEEVLQLPTEDLQKKAEEVYGRMYAETPDIGGKANPMADNLYQFITFCAYYEASDHQIDEKAASVIGKWMLEDQKMVGKIFNLNKKSSLWLMSKIFSSVAEKTRKKKANGEWGNTWSIEWNPKGYTEGVSFVLYGCPLLAFAKAHGYEAMMPPFCQTDHGSAALMHGRLLRFETEATGGSCCDYWYVGDQSETAKKYADLPKI